MSPALPFAGVGALTSSASESRAFGFSAARLTIGGDWRADAPDAASLVSSVVADLDSSPTDLVILRYPSELVELASRGNTGSRRLAYAGTLLYWEDPLFDNPPSTRTPGVERSDRGEEPREAFVNDAVGIIADSFQGYVNHYSYNDLIPRDVARDGYVEWTRTTIADPSGIGIVVHDDAGPVSAATLRLHEGAGTLVAEVELAGVTSSRQGAGRYAGLWTAIREAVHDAGATRLIISTQASNLRVQRAWARLGLVPLASFDTVHAVRAPSPQL